ncbi:hypothetical protein E4T56_gene15268 [Termitomyces sp. T112]|nr:hypothetical protein E4T56_gene15268 [Termitomyces sp. T112]
MAPPLYANQARLKAWLEVCGLEGVDWVGGGEGERREGFADMDVGSGCLKSITKHRFRVGFGTSNPNVTLSNLLVRLPCPWPWRKVDNGLQVNN